MHLPSWRAKLGIALPRKVQSSFCATQEALAVLHELLSSPSRLARKDTVFTLFERQYGRASLQSLLDTTPPKRVPVLWDGPAPAPSFRYSRSDSGIHGLFDFLVVTVCLTWQPWRKSYALLVVGIFGHRDNCRGIGVRRGGGCRSRYRQAALRDLPDPVPDISDHAPGARTHGLEIPRGNCEIRQPASRQGSRLFLLLCCRLFAGGGSLRFYVELVDDLFHVRYVLGQLLY